MKKSHTFIIILKSFQEIKILMEMMNDWTDLSLAAEFCFGPRAIKEQQCKTSIDKKLSAV